jgi:uncharacterized protein YjbJ (UPF0337 family)
MCDRAQTGRDSDRTLVHGRWCKSGKLPARIVLARRKERIVNKDQIRGRVDQAAGKAKKAAGKAVGNKSLEREGKVQNAGGKIQSKLGDLREDIRRSI